MEDPNAADNYANGSDLERYAGSVCFSSSGISLTNSGFGVANEGITNGHTTGKTVTDTQETYKPKVTGDFACCSDTNLTTNP